MRELDVVLRGESVVREGQVATEDVAIAGQSIAFVGPGASRGVREIDVSGAVVPKNTADEPLAPTLSKAELTFSRPFVTSSWKVARSMTGSAQAP